jgi:hypothetical protein
MANIVGLPTAAAYPVEQQPRRGRLPKSIGSLADARYRRYMSTEKKNREAEQRGYDRARVEEQEERTRLIDVLTHLTGLATSGKLRSIVLAADVGGRGRRLELVMAGSADKPEALSMAARLQHRIASSLDADDHDERDG